MLMQSRIASLFLHTAFLQHAIAECTSGEDTRRPCTQHPSNVTGQSVVSIMSRILYDVSLPWSNENWNGFMPAKHVCELGGYVTSLEWKEQSGHGLVDLRMTCQGVQIHQFTLNPNGDWNAAMSCRDGFVCGMAREEPGYGIVNFQASCGGTDQESNGKKGGAWNAQRCCPSYAPLLIGMRIEEQPGYGIINTGMICGNKLPGSTDTQLSLGRNPMTTQLNVSLTAGIVATYGATVLALLGISAAVIVAKRRSWDCRQRRSLSASGLSVAFMADE